MNFETLVPLLAIILIGSYFQTATGFGLAMIVIGAASGVGLAPVATLAAVVSFVTLTNSVVALPGKMHHIDWSAMRSVALGVVPAIVVGVQLLDYLSAAAADLLQVLLGATIVLSGIVFALRPPQLRARSSGWSFFTSGFLAGLFGGLFGMAGPPVIFQFYRQPLELVAIRNMLILVFACTSGTRTLFVAWQGKLDSEIWTLTAFAVPLVALTTLIGRRFPPPFSALTMRRLVFVALMLIGVRLVSTALPAVLARFVPA